MNNLKNELLSKTLAEKLYLIGFVLGVISLFFTWVSAAGLINVGGFQQDGYLFLILMLYPFITTLMKKNRNKRINLAISIVNLVAIIFFIHSKSITFFGETINVASTGMYVMLIATGIILVGSIINLSRNYM